MSLLGILFGSEPRPAVPPPPPVVPPGTTAGSTPLAAPVAAAATNRGADALSGASAGALAGPSARPETAAARPLATGTPITAPATRHAFTLAAVSGDAEDLEQARDAANERKWRLADVFAAISGGPRAQQLIEAANRPGPVQPGSLLEAIKALHPAPTAQPGRTV